MNKVTFIEEEHLYLNGDGIIVPSVTQLVDYKFNCYNNIPFSILNNKALYGTKVHQLIEGFEAGEVSLDEINFSRIDPNIKSAVHQYIKIKEKHPGVFDIKQMEQIVSYQGRYAGMFDLLNTNDVLIDIKTTANLHKEWLALQLGLYYLGLSEQGVNERPFGYCLWIPKSQPAELIKIDVCNKEECLEILEAYEKEHNPE